MQIVDWAEKDRKVIRIAVLDDCRGVRKILVDLLQMSFSSDDIEIVEFKKAPDNLSDLLPFDILFIDEVLVGVNGTEIVHSLLSLASDESHLPCVVFITGFPISLLEERMSEDIRKSKLIYAILEKPFQLEKLYAALYAVCPVVYSKLKYQFRTGKWKDSIKAALQTIFLKENSISLEKVPSSIKSHYLEGGED